MGLSPEGGALGVIGKRESGLRQMSSLVRNAFPSGGGVVLEPLEGWAYLYGESAQRCAHEITSEVLPRLSRDVERNRLAIAAALCLVDSRRLPADVREAIGLTPVFNESTDVSGELPELFHSQGGFRLEWDRQCGDATPFLRDGPVAVLESGLPSGPEYTAIELLGCLAGKVNGIVSGLCFQTTEFANGTVFIEDVWYKLRGSIGLLRELQHTAEEAFLGRRPGEDMYDDTGNSRVDDLMVVWRDCGGVWQPTRTIFQEDSEW